MAAQYWSIFTVVLPDPTPLSSDSVTTVRPDISFRIENDRDIITLLDQDMTGGSISAFLYVPDLPSIDPCVNWTSPHVPKNVTRRGDIPDETQYDLVALAPWVSDHPECSVSYIKLAAREDVNRGLIFFPTDAEAVSSTRSEEKPNWVGDESTWKDWTKDIAYPIWSISPGAGSMLMQQMADYSGNVSKSPFSESLSEHYPPENAVRLLADVTLDSSHETNPVLGRLWIFAIMILAILCGLTGVTSLILHLNQSRLRRNLRRRIASGEVDLEMLGLRRQRVPQKLLSKMPLYVYTSKTGSPASAEDREKASSSQPSSVYQRHKLAKRDVPYSQTACAICLEDFRHDDTVVRELPCQHIFHPECVDDFLRTNSSLCPMCKKSALPTGYCPEDITIAMVRRERMMRRMREYGTTSVSFAYILPAWSHRLLPDSLLRRHIRPLQGAEVRRNTDPQPNNGPNTSPQGRSSTVVATEAAASPSSPAAAHPTSPEAVPLPPSPSPSQPPPPPSPTQVTSSGDLEMGTRPHASSSNSNSNSNIPPPQLEQAPQSLDDLPPEIQALSPEERREWGRQRLIANLPRPQMDAAAAAPLSGWRRMFPS